MMSPFSMMLLNRASWYHVAAAAIRGAALSNPQVEIHAHDIISYVLHLAEKAKDYAIEYGADPEGTFDVPNWTELCPEIVRCCVVLANSQQGVKLPGISLLPSSYNFPRSPASARRSELHGESRLARATAGLTKRVGKLSEMAFLT
ncbi:hypothetical protein A0H81_13516 [Grifola frondosa]|uniref:Xylulose 5-phosphate/Fructose 6-phosphate phosphoketolase C-terminal domain-containing protein n=1 Tax=Grifola frondosa TaxID=5627 RepID=A0A1C7LNZ8_GRIFR|nr:hypothetical protein A0H81_13516 [Grifola frondosa]